MEWPDPHLFNSGLVEKLAKNLSNGKAYVAKLDSLRRFLLTYCCWLTLMWVLELVRIQVWFALQGFVWYLEKYKNLKQKVTRTC